MRRGILPLSAAAILLTALAGCYGGPYDDYYDGGYRTYGTYGDPYYGYDSPYYGYGGYYGSRSGAYLYPRWRDHDHDRDRHRHHKRWRDRDDDRDRDRRRARDRDRRDDDDERRRFREREHRDERDDRLRAAPPVEERYERRGPIARSAERRAWEDRMGLEAERSEIWRRDSRSPEK